MEGKDRSAAVIRPLPPPDPDFDIDFDFDLALRHPKLPGGSDVDPLVQKIQNPTAPESLHFPVAFVPHIH